MLKPYARDSFVPATLLGTLVSSSPSLHITTTRASHSAPLTVALMFGKRHFGLMCWARYWQGCQNKENFLYSESKSNKLTLFNCFRLQINTRVTFISEIGSRYFYLIMTVISPRDLCAIVVWTKQTCNIWAFVFPRLLRLEWVSCVLALHGVSL